MQGKHIGLLIMVLLLFSLAFIPIWRCGLQKNLTFLQFVQEHTIWGHPVEYVPEEDYIGALR